MKFIFASILSVLVLIPQTVGAQGSESLVFHTIVIDPGHGGQDPGCVSRDGRTYEKDLVLSISKLLAEKIRQADPNLKVLLTRDDDTFVKLNSRASFATRHNADLFISVHINANEKSSPNGYSVHLLGQSTDKNKDTYAFNMDVCKRENAVMLLEEDYSTTYKDFDPDDPESDIFLHLMLNAYREQSLSFAQFVDNNLSFSPLRKSNGVMQNNFAVLRLATMPAVLLELGFISNNEDLEVLRNKGNLDNIANNIYNAFRDYERMYYPESKDIPKAVPSKPVADMAPVQKDTMPVEDTHILFGTQILASKQRLDDNDRFFKGNVPTVIKNGEIYRYYIGVSKDIDEASSQYRQLSNNFSDSFFVRIEDGKARQWTPE